MHRKNIKLKVVFTVLFTALFYFQSAAQQGWDVPADKKAKNS